MTTKQFMDSVIEPAMALLPKNMDSDRARVMLITIALQESRLEHRWQVVDLKRPNVKGPARGLLQFESGGGVKGVMTHAASKKYAQAVCEARGVPFERKAIYEALSSDDILATALARLLLWTDPKALPTLGHPQSAWDLYMRVWRPGKPHRHTWDRYYTRAIETVKET